MKIKNLLQKVSQTSDDTQLYPLYRDLSKHYEVFVSDSAQLYTVKALLSVILLIAIGFVIKQIQKLSKAKKELTEINSKLNDLDTELQEANKRQVFKNF